MQIEVPSGRYLQHATAAQQTAAAERGDAGPVLEHDQVMTQLAELDKLGQEGAAPVDDAEVCSSASALPQQNGGLQNWHVELVWGCRGEGAGRGVQTKAAADSVCIKDWQHYQPPATMHAPASGCYWFSMLSFLPDVCGSFCLRLHAVRHHWSVC